MLWYYPLAGQNFDAVEVDVPGGVEDMDELANDIWIFDIMKKAPIRMRETKEKSAPEGAEMINLK